MTTKQQPAEREYDAMCHKTHHTNGKRTKINWTAIVSMLSVVVFWTAVGMLVHGCALKNALLDGKATAEDCTALQSYIDLCSSELAKEHLNQNTRKIWELALAGARIELARKCAGTTIPKPATESAIPPTVTDPIPVPSPVPGPEEVVK